MIKTYGKMPSSLPEGMFKAFSMPIMARMDTTTGDHRRLAASGGGARDLPTWSMSAQFVKDSGHDGAEMSGAVYEITFDDEAGIVSSRGFFLDDTVGQRHALAVKTGAMRGVSVGMAEVAARYVEDLASDEWFIEFTKWNVADVSGVMTPAFIDAHAEVTASFHDEITAAFGDEDPMVELVASFDEFDIRVPAPNSDVAELLASASGNVADYADFFRPEAPQPTKIVVTPTGKVFGHLSMWDRPHDGRPGVVTPRPVDGYRSFNKPGVLTERGIVPTGPIFAYGGHRPAAGAPDLDAAYGGVENAWCDVRVTEGQFGPWISGIVRPGVSDETVYAARASRISGHWVKGNLKAIVSVNAEGFEVEGPDADVIDIAAAFAYRMEGDEVVELVASFSPEDEPEEVRPISASEVPSTVNSVQTWTGGTFTVPSFTVPALDPTAFAKAIVDALRAEGVTLSVPETVVDDAPEQTEDPIFQMLMEE